MTGGVVVGAPPVGREPVGATVVVEFPLPPVGAAVLDAETVGSEVVTADSLLLVAGAAVVDAEVLGHFSATNFEEPVFTKKSDTKHPSVV